MVKKKSGFESYGVHGRIKLFILISLLVTIFDQCVKFFAYRYSFDKIVIIPKILWFTLVENTGAAFGIFSGRTYILGLVNLLVVLLIAYYNFKYKLSKKDFIPLAFIAGGALGNTFDRLFFGSVIDFIDLGWFPVFNIADSFIVIGFIWLIINEIVKWKTQNQS